MLEKYLAGKTGCYVDSFTASQYFPSFIEFSGGLGLTAEELTPDLIDQAQQGQLNFLIVHNYTIKDKDLLLSLRQLGVEMLIIERNIIPPEQLEEYQNLHHELTATGARVEQTSRRSETIRSFLEKVYRPESPSSFHTSQV